LLKINQSVNLLAWWRNG